MLGTLDGNAEVECAKVACPQIDDEREVVRNKVARVDREERKRYNGSQKTGPEDERAQAFDDCSQRRLEPRKGLCGTHGAGRRRSLKARPRDPRTGDAQAANRGRHAA